MVKKTINDTLHNLHEKFFTFYFSRRCASALNSNFFQCLEIFKISRSKEKSWHSKTLVKIVLIRQRILIFVNLSGILHPQVNHTPWKVRTNTWKVLTFEISSSWLARWALQWIQEYIRWHLGKYAWNVFTMAHPRYFRHRVWCNAFGPHYLLRLRPTSVFYGTRCADRVL